MSTATDNIRKAAAGKAFIGAVKDEWRMFSDDPADYEVGLPIGFGASSIVYATTYHPKDGSATLPCAVKVVDLDKLPPQSLRLLRRETQLMSLSKHPNVLRVRGSWVDGHKLYIALRLMNSGSAADVMRYGWPGGMEEEVVKCILKQALEGLNYLHINGFIHRDIKAANLLIDDDGTVLLGDLGVSASLCDEEPVPVPSGSRPKISFDDSGNADRARMSNSVVSSRKLGKRKSFVGTPCWMAPELISGKQYDAKADIWSFGITAIELTQGHAPRSREAPARVLLKTVQDDPPLFSREGGQYKYSKSFKEIAESCLVKDPARRPTAAELLEMPFFKSAKKEKYLVGAILKDLPPLTNRQERRVHPSSTASIAQSRSSISSWDFSVGPISPSTTVTHASAYTRACSPLTSISARSGSSQHSLNIPTLHDIGCLSTVLSPVRSVGEPDVEALALVAPMEIPALQKVGSSDSASGLGFSGSDAGSQTRTQMRMTPSPVSSVFENSSGSSSASLPLRGSSAATTPLSCSPAGAGTVRIAPPLRLTESAPAYPGDGGDAGRGGKRLLPPALVRTAQTEPLPARTTAQPRRSHTPRRPTTASAIASTRLNVSHLGTSSGNEETASGFEALKRRTSASASSLKDLQRGQDNTRKDSLSALPKEGKLRRMIRDIGGKAEGKGEVKAKEERRRSSFIGRLLERTVSNASGSGEGTGRER